MKLEKTFSTFIDVLKGVSIGYFVASLVGLILQENEKSLSLFWYGIILFILAILNSLAYDYIFSENKDGK